MIGIGGSATNDGGIGMAEALGVRFLDGSGNPISRGGAALANLAHIDLQAKDSRIDNVEVLVACDVQNTLCGEQGASAVYGPQKGASPSDVTLLDSGLARLGKVIESSTGTDVLGIPGGGAAGGLGAGLVAFCGAMLSRGIDLVLQVTGFEERLQGADLVMTGEGKIDSQVLFGKALSGVVERAKRHRVPVIAVVGSVEGARELFVNDAFLADLESLVDAHTSWGDAMQNAAPLLSTKTKALLQRYLSRKYTY